MAGEPRGVPPISGTQCDRLRVDAGDAATRPAIWAYGQMPSTPTGMTQANAMPKTGPDDGSGDQVADVEEAADRRQDAECDGEDILHEARCKERSFTARASPGCTAANVLVDRWSPAPAWPNTGRPTHATSTTANAMRRAILIGPPAVQV
jgi:hypothetical protein